ncbi:MAG: nitroreductase family deazaflavin-dependent oxidoreductase [Ktedonobacterales bacterium]
MTMPSDMRAYNRALIEEFRANDGKLGGQRANSSLLLLTTTGARSGQPRTIPLGYVKDGDRLIVLAANAGAPAHPDWYHNLRANPLVTVELGAERFQAHASDAQGAERERLAALIPWFAAQQAKTSRIIPVVMLDRLGADTEAGQD